MISSSSCHRRSRRTNSPRAQRAVPPDNGHPERVGVRPELPTFVTHYYLAGRRPFLSLSDLGDTELAVVLAGLRALRQAGKQHRPFGPRYMELRRHTETRLRELFVAAGGEPERPTPHYFVLGGSPWYEGLAEDMQRIELPLSALQPGQTSITYPDSFTAMQAKTASRPDQQSRPYHERVFLLGELPGLVERFGIPDPSWGGQYQAWTTWPAEAYIEVQLWTDEPIRAHLSRYVATTPVDDKSMANNRRLHRRDRRSSP
jgi:hypothetical protein